MTGRCPVILHVFQVLKAISHWTSALWTKYTFRYFGMDIPNLLNRLILTRNTFPLSLPSFQSSSIFLPSFPSFSSTSLLPYISLFYYLPLFLFPLLLLSSLFLSSSLPLYLPLPLSSSLPHYVVFITYVTTYLIVTTATHCSSRFKRVMFISCRQHVVAHLEPIPPVPPSTCVQLSLYPPCGRCLRSMEKLQ